MRLVVDGVDLFVNDEGELYVSHIDYPALKFGQALSEGIYLLLKEHYGSDPSLIVHQRLCAELVRIAKQHQGEYKEDVTEFMDLHKAIDVIERIYPQLKEEESNG